MSIAPYCKICKGCIDVWQIAKIPIETVNDPFYLHYLAETVMKYYRSQPKSLDLAKSIDLAHVVLDILQRLYDKLIILKDCEEKI